MQTSETFELISHAIENKLQMHATYKGEFRQACPHALGYKDGVERVLAVQFGGTSSQGLSADLTKNWRNFDLDQLEGLELVEGPWFTADNHSQPATGLDTIVIEVDY